MHSESGSGGAKRHEPVFMHCLNDHESANLVRYSCRYEEVLGERARRHEAAKQWASGKNSCAYQRQRPLSRMDEMPHAAAQAKRYAARRCG
jgi:hypothetical protein